MSFFRTRQPVNRLLIHKKHFFHNLSFFQSLHPQADIFPVLKSNAYGHGLLPIIKLLNKHSSPYIVIDSIIEYNILKNKTNKNFLMIGETLPHNYTLLNRKRITPCVWSLDVLKTLINTNKKRNIHLFINTGMNREWIAMTELTSALALLKNSKLTVEWVLSHLSCADTPDSADTSSMQQQVVAFKDMYGHIINAWHNPRYRHIWNSAATLKLEDDFFTAWRVWLGLFGYVDLSTEDALYQKSQQLKPCLELRSHLLSTQDIAPWQWVSYAKTRKTEKPTRVWVLPFWYNEWLPRSASNNISFKHVKTWNNHPQRWNICMNLCTIEIDKETTFWDEYILISPDHTSLQSMISIAQQAGTIPYEILVGLDDKMRREIV